jgi:hypothetical protein
MKVICCAVAVTIAGLAGFAPGGSFAQAGARSETPIREVVLSDGARRYAVRVTIGGKTIDAGLDSGSTGLRVLPGVLSPADATAGSQPDRYSYGSGAQLVGVLGRANLTIGQLAGPSDLQLVQSVGCRAQVPGCPATKVSLDKYGIQGDGLPGEGFKAILGVNMGSADAPNPLIAMGAKRWIIDLPRPGESRDGRLIINPTDEEAATYVRLPIVQRFASQKGGLHDAIQGCLVNLGAKARACGPVLLDTGAPGIKVINADVASPWPQNANAALGFSNSAGKMAAVAQFQVGQRAQASRLEFRQQATPKGTVIYSGLMPYFAFSVLYDPGEGELGFKARRPAPGGPVGALEK